MDFDALSEWPVEVALSYLQRLPGVGPKTAVAVVNFSTVRRRALVVDTHCLRLAVRLGLLPPKAGFGRAYRSLMRLVPDDWDADDLYELHWLMKRLGQDHCTHDRPRCRACPLRDLCRSQGSDLHPDPWTFRAPRRTAAQPGGAPGIPAY